MQRVSSGYTIVELLIVLTISGVLIGVSLLFLSGRLESNRFAQSMRDIQSKMQDWLNDIPTGFPRGNDSIGPIDCRKVGGVNGKPQISRVDGSSPAQIGDCIFLGKVIQFTDATGPPKPDQERMVYVYSVFGIRNVDDGLGGERSSTNLVEAHPVAADSKGNNGTADITEVYRLTGNSKVISVTSSGSVPNSHVAGFFLSFNQQASSRSGSLDLRSYQYPLAGNQFPANETGVTATAVDDCISMSSVDCRLPLGTPADQWPPVLSEWKICFGNDSNNQTALLTVGSSAGIGATTKLEFKPCS